MYIYLSQMNLRIACMLHVALGFYEHITFNQYWFKKLDFFYWACDIESVNGKLYKNISIGPSNLRPRCHRISTLYSQAMLRPIHIYIYLYTTTAGFVLLLFSSSLLSSFFQQILIYYHMTEAYILVRTRIKCVLVDCHFVAIWVATQNVSGHVRSVGYVPDRHTWFCPHVTCFHVFKRLLRFTLSKSCSLAISIFLSDELLTNY